MMDKWNLEMRGRFPPLTVVGFVDSFQRQASRESQKPAFKMELENTVLNRAGVDRMARWRKT